MPTGSSATFVSTASATRTRWAQAFGSACLAVFTATRISRWRRRCRDNLGMLTRRFASHIRFDRTGNETLLMRFVMHRRDLARLRTLLSAEHDGGP